MADESFCAKTATSASPPPASSSPADSYIGSFISLTSKYEIRYEGLLYYLNPQDSTLGLKNVKSYGTEGRKKDGPQIPANDKVYEYILFRGTDIKDLQVKSPRPSPVEDLMHNDPAIIQSQSATGHLGSLKSQPDTVTQINPYMDASAPNMRSYPQSSPQSGVQIVQQVPQMTQSADLKSYSAQAYWHAYNGTTSGNVYGQKHTPSVVTSFPSQPNYSEASLSTVPVPMTLTSSSINLSTVSSSTASNTVCPSVVSSYTSQQLVMPPMDMHALSIKSTLPVEANVDTAIPLVLPSLPPSAQYVNNIEELNSDQVSPRLPEFTPQVLYPNQKDVGVPNVPLSRSSHAVSISVHPAPQPLPLEPPGQQFTEEFDFKAMNEKFKKDEVWGYLGKAKQKDTAATWQGKGSIFQFSREAEVDDSTAEADSKPAYNKDDFFDSISRNTMVHRNRQTRFSERMKLDTETFGQFQQRTHSFGGYGPGDGMNHNQYGWGKGYNSGTRLRGGYMRY